MSATRSGLYGQDKTHLGPAIKETSECNENLIIKLSGKEYKNHVEKHLKALRTEYRIEDDIENAFEYTYNEDIQSFILTPEKAKIADIIKFFKDNGLMDKENGPESKLFVRNSKVQFIF